MWSLIWMLGLFCLISSNAHLTEKKNTDVIKKKNVYDSDTEIVFDEQPIKGNSLVYAVCKVAIFRGDMNCSVVLKSFPNAKTVDELTCLTSYKADKARQITSQFGLKKLFNNYVAFVWADEEKLQSDVPVRHLILSVINMDNCQTNNYDFNTRIEDFHVVAYDNTFDVYYRNKSFCGHFMCGQTFDSRGKVLNGPAASYLPSEYFDGNTQMCSVQSNSSAKGHYLITDTNFHLVTADYGKKIQMGPLPFAVQVAMYACNEEFLGYCWLTNNKHIVNCEQFNPRGARILSTGESLNYQVGTWMAMKNIGPSELLLLINRCDHTDSCAQNTKDVTFYVLRMKPNGKTDELHQFQGLECNNTSDIKTDVLRKEDGLICVTLACHARDEDGKQTLNLYSTCFLK